LLPECHDESNARRWQQLTEQQRRILEMIAQMQGGGQQPQVPQGYNVAQNMMVQEPLRLNQQNSLMAMPAPGAMMAPPPPFGGDAKGLMDLFNKETPYTGTFNDSNYITGVDDPRFKRPMSTGYDLGFGLPAY
jgi:hypothetical protein